MKAFLFIFGTLLLFSFTCHEQPNDTGVSQVEYAVPPDTTEGIKTIYIVRHAKSSHDDPDLIDFDRPLNDRGYEDAPFMGQKLNERDLDIDLIIASPANRTQTTALLIADELGYAREDVVLDSTLYGSTTEHYMNRVRELSDEFDNVMIVAHNNFSTNACNFFQPDTLIENLPTTGVFSISFQVDSWSEVVGSDVVEGEGTFNFMDYPKRYPERQ